MTYLLKYSFYLFLSLLLYYVFIANLNLTYYGHELFMDEQITFYEVKNILHANSITGLLNSIVFGDQRYGRIIYYITALFAFIPERIFGETGQIFSTRILFASILLFSYFILVKTFINDFFIKYLTLFSLLLIQSNIYFFTEPKPEPFQLVFLSIFLYIKFKKNDKENNYFFLGLAFGCKISILFLVFYFFFTEFLKLFNNQTTKNIILSKILYFILGFFISVPILFTSFISVKNLKSYLGSTFFATTFGSDNTNLTFIDWLIYILHYSFSKNLYINILFFSIFFILITIGFIKFCKEKYFFQSKYFISFAITFLSILPIIVLTKRIWLHYLHIGFVFLILLVFISLEKIKLYFRKYLLYMYICIITLSITIFYDFLSTLTQKSTRTRENTYLVQKKYYNLINYYLSSVTDTIYLSPQHFKLEKSNVIYIYGFFTKWDKLAPYVVLSNSNNVLYTKVSNKNRNDYIEFRDAESNYIKFVTSNDTRKYEMIFADTTSPGLYIYKIK